MGLALRFSVNIVNQIEYHRKMGIKMVCDKINPFLKDGAIAGILYSNSMAESRKYCGIYSFAAIELFFL
jgi:hypothetical protein